MRGYCENCGKECNAIIVDEGIGWYHSGSIHAKHTDMQAESDCCNSGVFADEELTEEIDYYQLKAERDAEYGEWLYEQKKDRELYESLGNIESIF